MSRTLSIALGITLAFWVSLAFAQQAAPSAPLPSGADEATRLKASGDALFDRGHFAEAYESYARAYRLQHDAALLYNEARALEAMGEYPQALDKLDEFERIAPPEVRARVPKLGKLTADLRSRITMLRLTTNAPNARLFVRDKDLGPIDRQVSVRVRAGTARIRLVADGYEPFEREVTLTGGGDLSIDAQLRPTRRATSESATKPLTSNWIFWTVVGAVVVGGVSVTAYALTTERSPETGTFAPGQIRP
jgi:hypothetical protein